MPLTDIEQGSAKARRLLAAGLFAIIILGLASFVSAIQPFGASVTEIRSERAPADAPTSDGAFAGNVTELTITGFSPTQAWQGYFGNVSGTIQLADANDNVMYNWSLANPQGEVYASTNSTISWTNVQCFNFTADGTFAGGETPGATNLHGTNLSVLESSFGMRSDDVDGVNETFGFTISHDLFYTANLQFSAGECLATAIYDSTGQSVSTNFQEVILYEPTTSSVIWTSILEEASVLGFDGNDYDFEMIVPEDGHATDTSTTTYYFFVELE